MTNKQFDALVRHQIDKEAMTMSKYSDNRLRQALQNPEAKATRRRFTARTLVVAVLILGLLCGVALAAVNWSSREFLTYQDDDGVTHVNEELLGHVQPIGQHFAGKTTKLDIVDAMYDGASLVMTWTIENGYTQPVYVLARELTAGGEWLSQGSQQASSEIFLDPGEASTSGASSLLEGQPSADACEVRMTYDILRPLGELVEIGALDGGGTEADYDAYIARIDALVAEGKLPLAPDGIIELGTGEDYSVDKSYADRLIDAGLMERVDEVSATFTVPRSAGVHVAQPASGSVLEKDNGGYTLRVVKAEMTQNAINIAVERVFPDKAALDVYSAYYGVKMGPMWGFQFLDEHGTTDYTHNSGGSYGEPQEMDDGSWLWPFEATMTNLQYRPMSLTIVPVRDDLETGAYDVPYPEEGLTITFE